MIIYIKQRVLNVTLGFPVPDAPDGEVPVRAAGVGAGAGVIDVGHQRVGRGTDHGLQVDAGVRHGRDRECPLPTQPGRQSGAGETGHWVGKETHKKTTRELSVTALQPLFLFCTPLLPLLLSVLCV